MTESRRERKVVTVLFCDLVGFTSQAESLDPEDVEAILRPYHSRVRAELERYGGTVEKFIGDAVMALFGAPVAHEDDPERAVRAALAIRDFAVEENLELRVGITTGEALVSLDASPLEGEGMASGDVVNTAARLQSGAPVNGVLVDETTYRATRAAVEFDDPQAIEAKGKAEPIRVRRALLLRSRPGVDVAHEARAELVGRERELDVMRDALDRVRQSRTSQLLTLVGVPGIGKSRLVYELSQIVEADPELITWRQGRCLAYGDGITLWALGEIVKAQAGIHEQDPPEEASAKVRSAVTEALEDVSDARWVESHLLALVGLAGESELGGDRRNEAFSAWRRFFEAMAEQRPLVLVVEDLHWADESLLDFVDELVDWVTDVPLLVVATGRPELLEKRPGWAGGKLNATTLALQPLSDDETAKLIAERLGRPVLAADSQEALLERAGGNPLYAEQFAELFLERGTTEALSLPETLQGIVSARLDGLPRAEKELLRDASVVGKVFWTGALRGDKAETATALRSLARKAFVRQQRRSSVEGENEFAFSHALVRDVAYGQIARADRAEKHRHTAEWIESLGRPEDHAEMLAYHWSSALELAEAAGASSAELSDRARLASRAAGDRAFALNAYPSAAKHYAHALAITPQDESRSELLFRRARALHVAGDEEAEEALKKARDALVGSDNRESAAECEAFLAQMNWFRGKQDEVFPRLRAAEALVEGAPSSSAVAKVLAWSARYQVLAGERERGLRRAEQALAMANDLGVDELRVHALTTVGSAKEFLGDVTGRADLERAVEIGRAANSPMVPGALNNLSVVIDNTDIRRVQDLQREAMLEAERFGDAHIMRFLRGNLVAASWMLGEWDEAIAAADRFIAECEQGSPHVLEGPTRLFRGCMTLARGIRDDALEDFRVALDLARAKARDPEAIVPALVRNAWAEWQLGRGSEARAFFSEALPLLATDPYARPWLLAEVAFDLGETSAVREILAQLPLSPGRQALLAVVDGDFEEAAEQYGSANILLFEAEARLRWAEQLFATDRHAEGEDQLERALAFYRPIGATLFVERGERLLAKSA
ncbi:MAG: AAA family ATPase [Actinomycetota bacterium]|nr:AAA family ATPase [Actinomycetota bacterium]